ncbi:hypothetical protein FHW67_002513 [Herbaspirillum sp. Sphag1AN]|uniref:DUF4123 domain-containing protein n=1 Tax=unclassified Herbaspirillum TaxID=2624150 RepID=UPI00161BBB8B|nr:MULTISPECIES: DUF4123 domain-containing protein [unclassified Herbaspirillum]MBB3213224.1 hypothetical protein [Herbaspirillum sp. Sphag1AN]MBB3246421.1 hypothetical protein [Herbaspirillum sp. Sphag64]
MIFGIDPHEDKLAESLDAALLTCEQTARLNQASPSLHTYALIDGAFDRDWGQRLLLQQLRTQPSYEQYLRSIYTDSRLEVLEECAPFLLRVSPELRLTKLERLLAKTNGKPMLSFIQSPLDLITLQRHLLGFSQVETPDTLVFPLRFADTICFPVIVEALSEPQRNALMAGIAAWHIVNRSGGISTFVGTCFDVENDVAPVGEQTNYIHFTDAQFAQVVAGAEADTLYKEMAASDDAIPHQPKASVLIGQLQAALYEMDKRHISGEKIRKELAFASLTLPDAQAMHSLLDVAQSKGLQAALASL